MKTKITFVDKPSQIEKEEISSHHLHVRIWWWDFCLALRLTIIVRKRSVTLDYGFTAFKCVYVHMFAPLQP